MVARKLAYLAAAMARQWWPREVIRRYQLDHLRRIVRHAIEQVPLYREKYRAAGVGAEDLRSLEDLSRFPLLHKDEVLAAYPEGICARPVGPADVVFHTSGTSGRFMNIAYDQDGNDFLDAVYGRALFATGYRPWDRFAYFWWSEGKREEIYQRLGLMRKIVLPSEADPRRQLELLCRIRPDAIYNFPTSMVAVAKLIEGCRPRELAPRVIVCHGELMAAESQRYLSEVFGCPVFNQYGAQEFNRIGWDCSRHTGLHLDVDSVHVELVAGARPAHVGEEGELVITGLHNRLMPLIRYCIGDVGRFEDAPCPCGRGLPVLHLTGGRVDDHFVLPSGRIVGPRMIVPVVERYHGFSQYRVVQSSADRVELLLVKEPGAPASLEDDLVAELRRIIDDPGVTVACRVVESIPLKGRGKWRVIERAFPVNVPLPRAAPDPAR
jgi:phenylacetate-CoA ligase